MSELISIQKLNEESKENFFQQVNILFETAPPLAQELYDSKPYQSYQLLIEKAQNIIQSLDYEKQIQVINAHPRIGASAKTLSAQSLKEQGYDAEIQESQEKILEELLELNKTYEAQFGFKFVVFVAGRPKSEIIPVIKERLNSTKETELNLGLSEMMEIAKDRLKKIPIK